MIPQAAPARRIARFRRQVDEAVAAVLGGEAYVLGAPVEGFEAAFARFCGAGHCVGVASGSGVPGGGGWSDAVFFLMIFLALVGRSFRGAK